MSIAHMTDNVTGEDVACVLAADGVTILQARDAHEWGLNTLNLWSQVVDANRRTEAMQALMAVRQLSSQEDWDRPVPLEPRWWYPSPGNFGAANTLANHMVGRQEPSTSATITPMVPRMMPAVISLAAQRAQEVAESAAQFVQGNPRLQLAPDDGVMGWMGIPVVYVQKKKKKKSGTRKLKAAHLREEEEIEEMSSGESVAAVVDNTSTTVADQQPPTEDPSGPPKDMDMT